MARDDLFHMIHPKAGLEYTTNAAVSNTTKAGEIIPMAGETGGVFLVTVQALTAGTLTLGIQDGEDAALADAAAVVDPYLVHADPVIEAPGQYRIAYFGIKSYIRLTVTGSADVAGAQVHAVYASCPKGQGTPLD